VIAEMGVAGATVEHICERAGFTRGAFYSNFADKDDVIDALVEREQNLLLDRLDAMFADVGREIAEAADLGTVLRAIIGRVLLAVPLDHQLTLVQAEMENFAIRRPDLAGGFIAINGRFRTRIAGFIVDAMTANGRELLVEPAILTDAIIGVSQRSVRSALLAGPDADPNEVSAAILPGLLLAFSRPVEA
jgi:AcrR family transcriptional regulator